MQDYESEYIDQQEIQKRGPQAVASANLGGVQSIEALAPVLLSDETFGVDSKYSETALAAMCDFCFLAVNFNRIQPDPQERISTTQDVGRVQVQVCIVSITSIKISFYLLCPRR